MTLLKLTKQLAGLAVLSTAVCGGFSDEASAQLFNEFQVSLKPGQRVEFICAGRVGRRNHVLQGTNSMGAKQWTYCPAQTQYPARLGPYTAAEEVTFFAHSQSPGQPDDTESLTWVDPVGENAWILTSTFPADATAQAKFRINRLSGPVRARTRSKK